MVEDKEQFKQYVILCDNSPRTADDYSSNLNVLSETLGLDINSMTITNDEDIDRIIQSFSQSILPNQETPAISYQSRCKSALRAYLRFIKNNTLLINYPDEIDLPTQYIEGSRKQITVNAYERNNEARQECIYIHGLNCFVCDINFELVYGELGKGFIHVHHIKPLSTIDEEYEVDPITDLIPLCPNCHAMVHRKKDYLTLEELKELFDKMN